MEPRLVETRPRWALVAVENVYMFSTRGPPELAAVRSLRRLLDDAQRAYPGGFGAIFLAEGNEPGSPEPEARRALAELAREPPPALRGTALVILRGGFAGATIRAVASGILLAARAQRPVKVFSTVADGGAWLLGELGGVGPPVADLERARMRVSEALAQT